MAVGPAAAYHPHAACLLFEACRNGSEVEANLRAVVAYGMAAQARGVTLEEAMQDIARVQGPRQGTS